MAQAAARVYKAMRGSENRSQHQSTLADRLATALAGSRDLFADLPPANPRGSARSTASGWKGLVGLAADVRHYGGWVGDQAALRLGPHPAADPPAARRSDEAALSDAVGRVRTHVVLDMVDHYSTGGFDLDATLERHTDAYADAIVDCLAIALDAYAAKRSDRQEAEARRLAEWAEAVDAVVGEVRSLSARRAPNARTGAMRQLGE